jgi:hypothetical protein
MLIGSLLLHKTSSSGSSKNHKVLVPIPHIEWKVWALEKQIMVPLPILVSKITPNLSLISK